MEPIKRFSCILLAISLSSCASMSGRDKTLALMGVGGVVGGILGGVTTPDDENSSAHIAMWAGIGAALTGVTALFVYDDDKKTKERERQIEALHGEVAALRGETSSQLTSKELFRSKSTLEEDVPKEYRSLVKPGGWSVYQVDQWVDSGDHMKIHQDKIFKLEPPQMNVGSN